MLITLPIDALKLACNALSTKDSAASIAIYPDKIVAISPTLTIFYKNEATSVTSPVFLSVSEARKAVVGKTSRTHSSIEVTPMENDNYITKMLTWLPTLTSNRVVDSDLVSRQFIVESMKRDQAIIARNIFNKEILKKLLRSFLNISPSTLVLHSFNAKYLHAIDNTVGTIAYLCSRGNAQ